MATTRSPAGRESFTSPSTAFRETITAPAKIMASLWARRNVEQWELVTEIPLDISVSVQEEETEKNPEVPEYTFKPAHKITVKNW